MSIKGGSYPRFKRALASGNPLLVRAAASELQKLSLADALAVCLVLLTGEPHRYPRAAVRWHAHLCLETRTLELADAALALAALKALSGSSTEAAGRALAELCEVHGQHAVAEVLNVWLHRRGAKAG